MCRATGPQPPRPPNMESIVELNRGPFLGAQPPLERLDAATEGVVLDVRDARRRSQRGHRAGRGQRPRERLVVRDEVRLRAAAGPRRSSSTRPPSEDAATRHARAARGRHLRRRRLARARPATRRSSRCAIEELERLLATTTVAAVRRAREGRARRRLHPGEHASPVPQRATGGRARPVRRAADRDDLRDRPARGDRRERAAVAAGFDARPVLDGGVATWRGERATSLPPLRRLTRQALGRVAPARRASR